MQCVYSEFVEAARATGASNARIIVRRILPSALGPIIVQGRLLIAITIITESGLSQLGFRGHPRQPAWSSLIEDAQGHMRQLSVFSILPSVMIVPTLMSNNGV